MNYLFNAINGPYQYYKNLAPINSATLTGAIDVIVIKRPALEGDGVELACSPFHVRFGKWQVLRPGEKMVDVTINGSRIPYKMKIGEAGEAFFVFETEGDVPDDLITSPLLEPTAASDVIPQDSTRILDGQSPIVSEPEFLDLNDPSSMGPSSDLPKDSSLLKVTHSTTPPSLPMTPFNHTQLASGTEEEEQNKRVDEALQRWRREPHPPNIRNQDGISMDMAGYHTHEHERSDDTITDHDLTPSPSHYDLQETLPFPIVRATSEPPPETEGSESEYEQLRRGRTPPPILPFQEYSWEWGAFPQPSPMKTTFQRSGRPDIGLGSSHIKDSVKTREARERSKVDAKIFADEPSESDGETDGRSHSVPPRFGDSPRRHERMLSDPYQSQNVYGLGGRLGVSRSDPTMFRVTIDGRHAYFELSDMDEETLGPDYAFFQPSRMDEVDAAMKFDQRKVDFETFIQDDDIINNPRLIIRWSGDQYITRQDQSPLMDALRIWKDSYVKNSSQTSLPRPSSPMSEEEDAMFDTRSLNTTRTRTEPPEHYRVPTSSSWVKWWSRKQPKQTKQLDTDPIDDAILSRRNFLKEMPPAQSAPALPSTPIESSTPLITKSPLPPSDNHSKRYAKTLRLTSEQLKSLNLNSGKNSISFALASTGTVACTARIFVWESTDLIVISDIDGTITKSDGLGHVFAMIGRDWTHVGVAKLYTDIVRNGYKIMYLTSRAIGQADATRDYLKGIKQNDYQLPEGPVIMSPDRLMASLHREVIMRKPEVFKMACLRDIKNLFSEASRNPFYAGFGNRITDALSYRSVNVPSSRIFTIDSTGEVKLELLELAGYKSSYIHMTDLVDQMFPPIHRKWTPEYTDFNYWKPPVMDFPLPSLSPPSPALSARSDTSNQSTLSRIRNFSLVSGRRPGHDARGGLPAFPTDQNQHQLQQMTSFERISNTLGFGSKTPNDSHRSLSPASRSSSSLTYAVSDGSDDEDDERKPGRRERTRSITSMPGSLDDMDFGVTEDEEGEEGQYDDDDGEDDEHVVPETFDDDILAAGEMQHVPFL